MIDMKCPSCGAGGRIPREKVNTRLVCKKCLRVFHVNAGGVSVLGEPAPAHAAPAKSASKPGAAPAPRHAARHDTVERFDDITSKLSRVKVPSLDIRIIGALALVVLLAAVGYWLFSRQTLERQSEEIARAFVKSDMKTAIDLSVPETAMDTIQWYSMRFKQYNELKLAFGGQEAGATIVDKGEKDGVAEVSLLFSKGGVRFDGSIFNDMFQPNPSLANTKQTLEIPLFWVKDFWGNWKLDGAKTYAGTASR
jgi:hypothetical protein